VLIIINKAAIKKKTLKAYIAAAKVVGEAQLIIGALATLRKQWEDSSTTAYSRALRDTIRALKKDSQ